MSFLDSTLPIFSLSNDKQRVATRWVFFSSTNLLVVWWVLSQVKRVQYHGRYMDGSVE